MEPIFRIKMAKKKTVPVEQAEPTKKKSSKTEPPKAFNEPTRGRIIGDNFGWTGKLPVTFLNEHCQKQKWGRVDYEMRKRGGGYTCTAKLLWVHPKTRETIRVDMTPQAPLYEPKETTNEARHYCATYALYRINFVKNMKMVMPTIFASYWSDLEKERLQMLKENKFKHDCRYNEHPFQVVLDERERNEKAAKDRLVKQQTEIKVKKPTVSLSISNVRTATVNNSASKESSRSLNVGSTLLNAPKLSTSSPRPSNPNSRPSSVNSNGSRSNALSSTPIGNSPTEMSKLNVEQTLTFPKKVWANAPFIDFSLEVRSSIESIIKKHIEWILEDQNEALLSTTDNTAYLKSLKSLGFRESHIKESFNYTGTYIDALEWLLFHLPEDDLPPLFSKSEKDSKATLTISKNIQLEYLVGRIRKSGMDEEEILVALKDNDNDELKTCVLLTQRLAEFTMTESKDPTLDSQELWEQEIDGIQMLESNQIEYSTTKDIVTISLNAEKLTKGLLSVRLFKSENYPLELPGIHIIVNNPSHNLADYIKLSIVKQLCRYIISHGFIGDCFIFSIVEWLEINIIKVIDHPGDLISYETEKKIEKKLSETKNVAKRLQRKIAPLTENQIKELSARYYERLTTSKMKSSLRQRAGLPAWKKKDELTSVINSNKVTIVTGETGSGKSTQIVQFVLDQMNLQGDFSSKIICTQPRRISTIGLAERISDERVDKLGNETGYIIRGENKTSKDTRISFVTTGVLLRMLQSFLSTGGSSVFDNLGYIFMDEVHERSVDGDFLLIILKKVMNKFPKLKIVLMSATIDTNTFKNFFNTPLNHIHIEGRTFPIKDFYLDTILEDLDYSMKTYDGIVKPKPDSTFFQAGNINYDLIANLSLHVHSELLKEGNNGSILIFLPGIMEINKCIREVTTIFSKKNIECWPLPLHSALTNQDQKRVFNTPPKGVRKIVVSTNVAETSITIPDCVVVIDSGRSKTMFYDPKLNTTRLIEDWCSGAEIGQRRGRSGRVTNGNCYHMYTKATVEAMRPQPIPEIRRTRLENLYLIVKSMGINNVEEFLNSGLDAPDSSSLENSKKFLNDIGALEHGNLSHLGKYLSFIPTDLQSGKLLILGCIFGCLDVCLTLAAMSSTGNPFSTSFEQKEEIKKARNSFSQGQGDFVAVAVAFQEYQDLKRAGKNTKKFLTDNFLSYMKMTDIASVRTQYISILRDLGFVPMKGDLEYLNRNCNKFSVVRSVITGAYYPQIAQVQLPDPKFFKSMVGAVALDPDAKKTKYWLRNENFIPDTEDETKYPATRAFIHPSSVLFGTSEVENTFSKEILEKASNEDGEIDFDKARALYANLTPTVKKSNPALKSSFVVYCSSHQTTKLYLRDVTPTSTLATLLFGGDLSYNLVNYIDKGRTSPGLVLDNWMPIRTWCKNGVLIKRLRKLVDILIEDKLGRPGDELGDNSDIQNLLEGILDTT